MKADPLTVVCPECRAAVMAKCTEPRRPWGHDFIDTFHQSRIDLVWKTANQDRDNA